MTETASNTKPKPYADAPRFPEQERVDPATVVPGGAPLELEIGPGRGGFLYERLAAAPDIAMIGFEIRRKWATIVDRKLGALGYGRRARVFAEDARVVLPRLPEGSVARAFIHFPDPWWKKRHQKRLVISSSLVPELTRVLRSGGELFVQTDVEERAEQYERELSESPELEPAPGGPRVEENPFGARSPREHRAIQDGLPIYRLLYRRR